MLDMEVIIAPGILLAFFVVVVWGATVFNQTSNEFRRLT